ncbi:MAG TPA: glutathione S-transferase family protein [Polyangiales bacterium]|jgi:glutathione S-transferase|nr:glutathione S-transferase family protein [Polyangiales bacterium]
MASLPPIVLCDFEADPGVDGYVSYSPFVLEVDRALRLSKLPYRHERIPYQKIKALNPTGQLPALKIGDETVSDSTRILLRIEELAPGSMSAGLDPRALAEAWLWEEFSDTALYPHALATRWFDDRGWHVPRKAFFGAMPPILRDVIARVVRNKTIKSLIARDFIRAGAASYEQRLFRVLDWLELRAPEQGFWMGAKPSVADLGLFAHLHQMRFPGHAYRAEDIAQRKRLSAWLDRVDQATR